MKPEIELFPYVLLRIAGGPFGEFQQTDFKKLPEIITELQAVSDELVRVAQDISDQLYALIPTIESVSLRKTCIKTRRDVYNRRSIGYVEPATLAQLPLQVRKLFARYTRLRARLSLLQESGENTYEKETRTIKTVFAKLLRTPNLQNGLLLSSDTITASLKKYLNSGPGQASAVSKKERSFVEYLSRMYAKPTPFSTFTQLAIARFGGKASTFLTSPSTSVAVNAHIQLNHALYQYIAEFMMQRPEIRSRLRITLNFTIRKSKNQFTFLTNYRNQESFQSITGTPSLEVFYALLQQPDTTWTYGELVQEITTKKYIAATKEAVQAYLDRLLDIGFLAFDIGVSGVDRDWAARLAEKAAQLGPFPLRARLVRDLNTLQKLAARYATASTAQRQKLLRQAHQHLQHYRIPKPALQPSDAPDQPDGIFRHTPDKELTLKPYQFWYEDTALSPQLSIAPRLKGALDALGEVLVKTGSLTACLDERGALVHFFITTYGEDACVSLLQFYRAYSRHSKKVDSSTPSPLLKARIAERQKVLRAFMRLVKGQLNHDEIHVTRRHFAGLPDTSAPAPSSFAAFFHAYDGSAGPMVVLNSSVPGHGKLFSRFLYLFDPAVAEALRSQAATPKPILMAEASDASVHNADVHEPLMPYTVHMPGGQKAAQPSQRQLRVDELEVTYDAAEQCLILRHIKSKQQVSVFDLGFQGSHRRSKLYNLLRLFNLDSHHHIDVFTGRINEQLAKKSAPQEDIVVQPRIVYENQVILQRKLWQVPKKQLPIRQGGEAAWDYFVKLQAWAKRLGLPPEVFVRQGFGKPQYISLRNPLLVALFERLVSACDTTLQIEEMLPDSSQLFAVNGGPRVTEFLCQWELLEDSRIPIS